MPVTMHCIVASLSFTHLGRNSYWDELFSADNLRTTIGVRCGLAQDLNPVSGILRGH